MLLVFSLGQSNDMEKMVVPTEFGNLIHLLWCSHYLDLEKESMCFALAVPWWVYEGAWYTVSASA